MASNIEFNDLKGTYSSYSVKEVPWHKLGKTVTDYAKTSKEVIEQANLDFLVLKGTVKGEYARPINGVTTTTIPNTAFTYREDTGKVLTRDAHLVTNAYEVVQNTEAFDFFDSIVENGVANYETAGVLGNGETIFVTAKLPEINLANKDLINQYLLFTMRHDGTGAVNILFTPIRVVCNNTLTSALMKKEKLSFKHTKNVKEKIERSKEILGILPAQREVMTVVYNKLVNYNIKDEKHIQLYLAETFLKPNEFALANNTVILTDEISTRKINQFSELINYAYYGIGQNELKTAYDLYNSITGYTQNVKYLSKQEKSNFDVDTNESIFQNNYFGVDKKLRDTAFIKALELTSI